MRALTRRAMLATRALPPDGARLGRTDIADACRYACETADNAYSFATLSDPLIATQELLDRLLRGER